MTTPACCPATLHPRRPFAFLVLLICFCAVTGALSAQSKLRVSVGAGVNYSKLFLEQADVPIIDTYNARIGANLLFTKVQWILNPKSSLSAEAGFSVFRTRDNYNIITSSAFASLPLAYEYRLSNRFALSAKLYYQYLVGMRLTLEKKSASFTYFANHRHFINPGFGVSYAVSKYVGIELNALFSSKDLFNGGAEDLDGNIVGPLKTYNHSLNCMIWYNLAGLNKYRRRR
ncbi:MAG: outer membrane beta-barrel protein [Saprospiraceae bacterium]|nr:outer membrane beta-barrel protein [Saprospiraceae bacterium]